MKSEITNDLLKFRKYLTVSDLSIYTGIAQSTIYKKVHLKSIPFLKLGRMTRFDRDAIDEWIRGGEPLEDLPKLPKL